MNARNAPSTVDLDLLDRKILDVLQDDVTIALTDLADRVGSSRSVVWRRMQGYAENGVIERRVAVLDPKKIGFNFTVFALVKIQRRDADSMPSFVEAVKAIPQVLDCHMTLGQVDFLLKIVVTDIEEYREVVWNRLSQLDVQEISSLVSFDQPVKRSRMKLE